MKEEDFTGARKTFKTIYKVVSKIALVFLILVALFLLYVGISHKIYKVKGDKKYEPMFSIYSIISPSMHHFNPSHFAPLLDTADFPWNNS